MNTNNLKMVFTENKHELWFFNVIRPRKQYIMYYIFRCISKINELRER